MTIRAARLSAFGEPLRIDDVPPPADPAPDEVAVRLAYASVNPLDVRLCRGGAGRVTMPFVPGCDGVGYVENSPVAVYGAGVGLRRAGTYAEQVIVPRDAVVTVPAGIDGVAAAGIGLAGVTAWGIVTRTVDVTSADRVLVLGATGGVGTLAVQLARIAGARVWAHANRADAVDVVRALGAEEVVVADAGALGDAVRAFSPTVVIDGLGGEFTGAAVLALATGGRLALFGVAAGGRGTVDLATVYRKEITVRGHATLNMPAEQARAALSGCLELVAAGRLWPAVADVLPLAGVNTAHARLTARGTTGKLLLAIAE